jgi:hypothetical protein
MCLEISMLVNWKELSFIKIFKIEGEEYKPIKETELFYLCEDEFGINLKRIPKLTVVK